MKIFHIFTVMAWMAGIFYLPRIFVHYAEGKQAGEDVRRLIIMAEKLLNFMNLLLVTVIFTGGMLWLYYGIGGKWLYYKLIFVCLLIGYHAFSAFLFQQIRRSISIKKARFYRFYNEIPVFLLLPILYFVTFKI